MEPAAQRAAMSRLTSADLIFHSTRGLQTQLTLRILLKRCMYPNTARLIISKEALESTEN